MLTTSRKLINYIKNKSEVKNIFRNYATKNRFYKNTGILKSDGKFEVTLDQRKLKTPKGNLFTVDSEPLALAVATEWNSQKKKIIQSNMHITTLCNTVIDNPNNLTKLDVVNYITNYLDTDTVLFQANVCMLWQIQLTMSVFLYHHNSQ
ncbi:hypothetical protein GWI33_011182 [Rhynchophorus ferrugineus]|uniref:ATP synthase mitochondrial F1 complex assembly factor 2 n=1 Tax=Rhynchophorus ferrugineus TaxID=354439 RepID=A0A834M9N7_RHYFE|nr:hypothetical protein GWI33_011182 [Rhynchophorus ferrugineus]